MTDSDGTDSTLAIALARVEVKLDAALAKTDDHEHRLRAVERRLWAAAGAASAAAIAGSQAINALTP